MSHRCKKCGTLFTAREGDFGVYGTMQCLACYGAEAEEMIAENSVPGVMERKKRRAELIAVILGETLCCAPPPHQSPWLSVKPYPPYAC